jgi:hypothetical protein
VAAWRVELDTAGLGYALAQTIEGLADQFGAQPGELASVQRLETVTGLARSLPFEINLLKAQNVHYGLLKTLYPKFKERAAQGDKTAQAWISHFVALGEKLRVFVE